MGRSRGGRTTKIHALSDDKCRPLAFIITGGNVYDGHITPHLLPLIPAPKYFLADMAYDANKLRRMIKRRGIQPVIPNKPDRIRFHAFDAQRYKDRNAIERSFCRLKDFRRIATRYDKLAKNYLSSLYLAALVAYWIC